MLPNNHIFVFGSNMAGIHGGGAARYALDHYGALWGKGEGLQGQSYALPTKDKSIRTLPLETVEYYVKRFRGFAAANPNLFFQLTPVGCGLAGLRVEDIAPMFVDAPLNVLLPDPTFDLMSADFTRIVLELRNAK